MEDIDEANANGGNEKIISILHKEGTLDLEVSSPKVNRALSARLPASLCSFFLATSERIRVSVRTKRKNERKKGRKGER